MLSDNDIINLAKLIDSDVISEEVTDPARLAVMNIMLVLKQVSDPADQKILSSAVHVLKKIRGHDTAVEPPKPPAPKGNTAQAS